MSKAFVLMTALPPTKGHLQLLQFSKELADTVIALVCTQPGEPFAQERFSSILFATHGTGIHALHFHQTIEQNPEAPGFWGMWKDILEKYGFRRGDYIVASEEYGKRLADEIGGKFMPYDLERSINPAKGAYCRSFTKMHFSDILPEFQKHLRQKVTFIGAESTGKTTLSKGMALQHDAHVLFEWARPYLEVNKVPTITYPVMNDIWAGQRALQDHAEKNLHDKPWLIQDTDLFSTVGYWDFWRGDTPEALVRDATQRKSDLYIIVPSNIPFEEDPIRYGNGERESKDDFWIALMEKHNLNYRVLESNNLTDRAWEVFHILGELWDENVTKPLSYERAFN